MSPYTYPLIPSSHGLQNEKIGILFLNLGGPEKITEVEDFLFNLFNDPDIIRLPGFLQPLQGTIMRVFVFKLRAHGRGENIRTAH